MALYALGDMHLAFSVDKPMDRFGKVWKKHEEKLEKNCRKLIGNEDTFVITGDHHWRSLLGQKSVRSKNRSCFYRRSSRK